MLALLRDAYWNDWVDADTLARAHVHSSAWVGAREQRGPDTAPGPLVATARALSDSGKFARLRELADIIAAKQEKVLVFTQFREATQPIADFLGGIFGREGLVLHGGTPVGKRKELVRRFQQDELIPYFVLSLKASKKTLRAMR